MIGLPFLLYRTADSAPRRAVLDYRLTVVIVSPRSPPLAGQMTGSVQGNCPKRPPNLTRFQIVLVTMITLPGAPDAAGVTHPLARYGDGICPVRAIMCAITLALPKVMHTN